MQIDENLAKVIGFFTVIAITFGMIVKQAVRLFWSDVRTNTETSASANLIKTLQRENARMSVQISDLFNDKLNLINRIAQLECSVSKLVMLEEKNSAMLAELNVKKLQLDDLQRENIILKSSDRCKY